MGVWEDITATWQNNSLTMDQKRALITQYRAEEWERVQSLLPVSRTFNATIAGIQRSVTVNVTSISRSGKVVTLDGTDNRNLIDWPIRVINPPILYPDPAGTITVKGTTYRLDAAAVLRDCIRDVAVNAAKVRFG